MTETKRADKPMIPNLEDARLLDFGAISRLLLNVFSHAKYSQKLSQSDYLKWINLVDLLFEKARQSPYSPPAKPALTRKDRRKWVEGRGTKWQEHKKLYDEYLACVARWEEEAQNTNPAVISKLRIAENRKKELQQLLNTNDWPPVERVPWRILPPGEWPVDLGGWSAILPCKSDLPPQPERLDYAKSLGAVRIVVGQMGDFDSYASFHYPNSKRVLLESPEYGNAAYVLNGNWEQLSRLTKFELTRSHRHEIKRISHRDDGMWRRTLRQALNL
jgi:hypothetical protein